MNATTLARSAKLFSGTTASLPHVWSYGKRAYRTTQKRLAEIDALRACQLAISLSTWNRENAFVMLYTLQTPAWRVRDRQSTALGKRGWIYEEGMRRQIAFDASNKVTLYTSHGAINSSFLQLARLDLVITYTWGWMKQRLTTSVCAHSNIMLRAGCNLSRLKHTYVYFACSVLLFTIYRTSQPNLTTIASNLRSNRAYAAIILGTLFGNW